jgi:hypothetical protein
MRLSQLRAFIDKVNDDAYPCKYGHTACAVRPGGRCSDELWNQACSDETQTAYEERLEENDFLAEEVNDDPCESVD